MDSPFKNHFAELRNSLIEEIKVLVGERTLSFYDPIIVSSDGDGIENQTVHEINNTTVAVEISYAEFEHWYYNDLSTDVLINIHTELLNNRFEQINI